MLLFYLNIIITMLHAIISSLSSAQVLDTTVNTYHWNNELQLDGTSS